MSILSQLNSPFLYAVCGGIIAFITGNLINMKIPCAVNARDIVGAMAYKYFRRSLDVAVWPMAAMSLLFILVPSLTSSASFMILPSGALAIGIAYLKFKKSQKGA